MKTQIITSTILAVSPGAFGQVNVPTAEFAKFHSVIVEKKTNNGGSHLYSIYGEVVYANSCMISDFKFKHVEKDRSTIHYRIFRGNNKEKVCPKIYKPIAVKYLIDQIHTETYDSSKVFMNDMALN